MATASYSFEPGQTVWCVVTVSSGSSCEGVQPAVVKKVTITSVLPTIVPVVEYQVQYTNPFNGSAILEEQDLFGDVDSALTEYRSRITV